MAAKKQSGFVTEAQRKTKRLTLRLKPEMMDLLISLSTEASEKDGPMGLAETVEQALLALDREMTADCKANGDFDV